MLDRKLPPLGLGNQPALGNADQRIMRLVVLATRIERLVGGDERKAVGIGELQQARLDLPLFLQGVTLQLDIEPVAKQRMQMCAARRRKLALAGCEREIERTIRAAAQRDEPAGLLERRQLDVRRFARGRVEE